MSDEVFKPDSLNDLVREILDKAFSIDHLGNSSEREEAMLDAICSIAESFDRLNNMFHLHLRNHHSGVPFQ